MARINAEDEWWKDKTRRRAALIKAIARRDRNVEREADGTAMEAWRLSQEYWKDGRKLIPLDVWERADLGSLIECGLAEVRTDGVYVRGSLDHHDWLHQSSESGRDRSRGTRDAHGRFAPKGTVPDTVTDRDGTVDGPWTDRDGTVDGPSRSSDGPATDQPLSSSSLSSESQYNPPKSPLRGDLEKVDAYVAQAVRVGIAGCEVFDKGLKNAGELAKWIDGRWDSTVLRELVLGRYGHGSGTEHFLRAVYKARRDGKIKALERELRSSFRAQLSSESTGPPPAGAEVESQVLQ